MSKKINNYVNVIALWVLTAATGFVIIFPVFWIFISSITPSSELFSSPINYITLHPTIENYSTLLETTKLLEKLFNTLFITICALAVNTVICVLAAYGFSRFQSKGLNIAYSLILLSLMIPAVVKARPLYEFFMNVRLLDTYPGLIILYTSNLIPFAMVILANFLRSVPISIDESAEVDGANLFHKITMIILPLVMPAIATVLIINFISCTNDLFTPLIYANKIQTLSVAITTLPSVDGYSVPWELVSAMGCVIILPIIVFICIFEQQIMDGIMAGGVKG